MILKKKTVNNIWSSNDQPVKSQIQRSNDLFRMTIESSRVEFDNYDKDRVRSHYLVQFSKNYFFFFKLIYFFDKIILHITSKLFSII